MEVDFAEHFGGKKLGGEFVQPFFMPDRAYLAVSNEGVAVKPGEENS